MALNMKSSVLLAISIIKDRDKVGGGDSYMGHHRLTCSAKYIPGKPILDKCQGKVVPILSIY